MKKTLGSEAEFRVFRRLYWLPEPVYYWLLDRLTDNNGWRPLHYRHRACRHADGACQEGR